MTTHTGEYKYKCSYCEKINLKNHVLKRHMKVHINEKTLNLKKDVKTHSYGNPYQCTLCDKCFINEKELKIHIKDTHTGENHFNSPIVTKHFHMKVNLITI